MSILNVNKINPVGGGSTVTIAGIASVTGNIISSGTITGAHHGDGANLTGLPAANLTGTLPAISGANLTGLPAANLTGPLPAISGANLTDIAAGVGTADSINTSGIITATSFNGQGKFSNLPNKNLFTNGAVNISQRGNSYSSANSYKADQWYLFATGSTTERLTTSPPDGFTYYLRCPSTSNSIIFLLPIELTSQGKVGHLKSKTLTVSWYARSESSNTMYVYADFRNAAGGGDFTAVYNGASDVSSLTSSWVRYSRTFTISVTPHANNKALFIQLRTPSSGSGSTGTLEITGAQCEFGDTMTDFEHISPTDDLVRCQRYYQQDTSRNRRFWGSGNVSGRQFPVRFAVEMRDTPSVSFPSTSIDSGSLSANGINKQGYYTNMSGSGRFYEWQHTATAEI